MDKHLKMEVFREELEKNPNIAKAICDFYEIPLSGLNAIIEAGEIPSDAIRACDRIYGRPFLHFFKFNSPVIIKDISHELLKYGGKLTGDCGPHPNSFDFRISTYAWTEGDWIKWEDFLKNLENEFNLEIANSNLPEKDFQL